MSMTLPFGGFLDIKTELLIRNLSLLVFDHELLCWFENMMSLGTFSLRSCQKSRPQEQGHRDWKPPMEAQPFLLFSSAKPALMLTVQRWEEMRFGVDRELNGQRPCRLPREQLESVFLLFSPRVLSSRCDSSLLSEREGSRSSPRAAGSRSPGHAHTLTDPLGLSPSSGLPALSLGVVAITWGAGFLCGASVPGEPQGSSCADSVTWAGGGQPPGGPVCRAQRDACRLGSRAPSALLWFCLRFGHEF